MFTFNLLPQQVFLFFLFIALGAITFFFLLTKEEEKGWKFFIFFIFIAVALFIYNLYIASIRW